jgi:hypothetical protein
MKNGFKLLLTLMVIFSFAVTTPALAKKDGDPAGWSKGEKKGWNGENVPPGFSKADAKKAERDTRDAAKKAEKDLKKKQKEAEKEARKQKKQLEKQAKEQQKQLEKANS